MKTNFSKRQLQLILSILIVTILSFVMILNSCSIPDNHSKKKKKHSGNNTSETNNTEINNQEINDPVTNDPETYILADLNEIDPSEHVIYYVSSTVEDIDRNATPNTAVWEAARNIETPCDVRTAFKSAKAGDVVYFRGGTYNVPQKDFGDSYGGYYSPSYSGTGNENRQRIIFKAYPDDMAQGKPPIFNGTVGGSGDFTDGYPKDFTTIFGVYQKKYITFDGFTFKANNGTKMARMMIGEDGPNEYEGVRPTAYIIIKNCTFNGGSEWITNIGDSGDNREGLRIEDSSYVLVKNCLFYNYRETKYNWNTSAYKNYHPDHVTIEHCEFHDCMVGIYDKSGGKNNIYRYNYFWNVVCGIYAPSDGYSCTGSQIYHNVIHVLDNNYIDIRGDRRFFGIGINKASAIDPLAWKVYNNTIYITQQHQASNNPVTIQWVYDMEFYNNIIVGYGGDWSAQVKISSCGQITSIKKMDYNLYTDNSYPAVNFSTNTDTGNAYSLADWRSYSGLDMHSEYKTPVFMNTSGNMNQIADFKLKSTSPGYKAGSDGNDMGADIDNVGIKTN